MAHEHVLKVRVELLPWRSSLFLHLVVGDAVKENCGMPIDREEPRWNRGALVTTWLLIWIKDVE